MTRLTNMHRARLARRGVPALIVLSAALAAGAAVPSAGACTRILWNDNGVAVMASRSMDWRGSSQAKLHVMSRGVRKSGASTITFSRYLGAGTGHVFTMAPDGSHVEQITFGSGVQAHSALSPDGTRVVYSQVDPKGSSINVVRLGNGAVTVLNRGSDWSLVPSWSPDGRRIAFTSDADGNYEIYTMAADGTHVRQLTFTDPPVQHVGPKYSPDGTLLLYATDEDVQNPATQQDLWVMPSAGGTGTRLTHGLDNRESRGWSPDGRHIVTQTVIDGVGQLVVLNADGSGGRQITHYTADTPRFEPGGIFPVMRGAVTPAWSPDGAWIAFAANPNGNYDVYRIRPDGSGLTRVTRSPEPELSINWGPHRAD